MADKDAGAAPQGERWWEGKDSAGFDFTADAPEDDTDDYTSAGCPWARGWGTS